MQLITDLINSIKTDAAIKEIIIGVHWTAICSRFCGMASTVVTSVPHGEGLIENAGRLKQISAKELAHLAQSENTLEASVGLAGINSLLKIPNRDITCGNAFDIAAIKGAGKSIAVFGHFPGMDHLRAISKSLSIFELSPNEGEFGLEKVPEILPDADVVAITSNAIINHTLDQILPYLKPDAFSVMVGPSTPLSPILFDYGISMLAGIRVIDPQLMFQSVSQGAIFRQVQGVELVTILK